MTIRAYIKAERERRDWSLQDLAERCGVAKSHLWKIERDNTDIGLSRLVRIAAAFDTGAGDMLAAAGYTVKRTPGPVTDSRNTTFRGGWI